MAQFIHKFSGLNTSALVSFLASSSLPFSPSTLYDLKEEETILDESLRLSTVRKFKDPAAFALIDSLMATLHLPHVNLTLLHDDVTHIKYKKGGYFSPHHDYLSLVSNFVQEYTLLICVTPPQEAALTRGGETRVVGSKDYEVVSKATTTPGCALLFRKDLLHEGLPILEGTKEIVSLNVWVTRKEVGGERLLLVTLDDNQGFYELLRGIAQGEMADPS